MSGPEFVVDFPTLGDLWSGWVEAHCRVPDRHERGEPFREYDWQFWCTANDGRVREGARQPDLSKPLLNQAFVYRRSQVIAPQKMGKGPWTAARVALAAVGPSEFLGWAKEGDVYDCREWGCDCGWVWEYLPGEPMGRRHPSPLIQIMATSDDQVDNIWRQLVSMIHLGPLKYLLKPTMNYIRVIGGSGNADMDRIDRVTASAQSRLGQPISAAFFDESGLYTPTNRLINVANTMRRGAAGMGGRSFETTNAFNPAEASYAQRTLESQAKDIFKYWRNPDAVLRHDDGSPLSFRNKRDRRRILEYVYSGAVHISLDSVEAECAELMVTDPEDAERFFGNRLVRGAGRFLSEAQWDDQTRPVAVGDGVEVCGGMDGSLTSDWTAIRLETKDGYRFTPTYGPDRRPTVWDPAEWGGSVPRGEVIAAVDELVNRFSVKRFYVDPRHWETQADAWAAEYGEKVFVQWPTNSISRMFAALDRFLVDVAVDRSTTHDDCPFVKQHALNAVKVAKPGDRYLLGKPSEHEKIDVLMSDVLAHEAAADQRAAGWGSSSTYVFTSSVTRRG
ncbi:MAG TPA: hypothetical protein VK054_04160 [Beutenbergiaceae bacterium]|nr:hypothetical protein [Beutenbergiaceae bacterium]